METSLEPIGYQNSSVYSSLYLCTINIYIYILYYVVDNAKLLSHLDNPVPKMADEVYCRRLAP